jgi:putative tryptophan/tyrosine transport system substrate-binding protein
MKRREFIMLLNGAAVWPLAARSQQIGKIPLLGILNPGTAGPPGTFGFYKGLRELGYTEGQNIAIERRLLSKASSASKPFGRSRTNW